MPMTTGGSGVCETHAPATLEVTEPLDRTPPACYKNCHEDRKVVATNCAVSLVQRLRQRHILEQS
jgi:hypothetical protein